MVKFQGVIISLSLVSLIALALSCSKESSKWKKPFFFIQMADTQFGMHSGNEDFEEETKLYEKAIQQANRLKPAFVVICGDLINLPGDSAQAAELLRISKMLDKGIPLHFVAGNHDVGNNPTPESLQWYRKTIGRDIYDFQRDGCQFTILNSLFLKSPDSVRDEANRQWSWLTETLKNATENNYKHSIIFMHHPLFLHDPDENDDYFNITKEVRQKYMDLFQKYSVTAIFAGHYHRNSLSKFGSIEMVITGAVGKSLGEEPSGFRIVYVYSDHIEHEYFGLDDVPDPETISNRLNK
ncbi:metallophosphoesterase [candidate division KSB1 bacterium]|nr:metallophosphoesterase [candidate division KSB1 bacterium]